MDISTTSLSVLHSPLLSSNLFGVTYKQFKRTYPGNYSFNFVLGLSSCNDFSVKNYTNFFLTERMKLSDVVDINDDSASVVDVQVNIKSGEKVYLTFNKININVGTPVFTTQQSSTVSSLSTVNLHLQIFDDNRCNIYYVSANYKKYFLVCEDGTDDLYFVRERFLNFNTSTINPQDFTYLFSEDSKRILLFKDTPSGTLILVKSGNNLVTTPVLEDQLDTYIRNSFTITRDLHFDPSQTLDFSYITYTEDNKVNESKSLLSLRNNFLLHKKYSVKNAKTDVLVLKNQLLVDDVFASANSLLSGGRIPLYVDDLREYTSIFDDIKEETTSELELNYVFYNQSYRIKPGSTTFVSPSSMYPFTKLNINDSKFIPSGAFGHITPEFADRVYHISNEPQNAINGQYLLCTWLSGSSLSENKVWIDRYYYPDLIEKEDAITLQPFMYPTYDKYIEQLISNNTSLLSSISRQKIFDKISDFTFEPNQTYRYDRISQSLFTVATSATPVNVCDSVTQTKSVNYFKDLNESGKFTFAIYFKGDSSTWKIYSDRNAIDAGVNITKSAKKISMSYRLFDTSKEESGNNPASFITGELDFQPLKENFLCISVDSINGTGYFCLNNTIVKTFTFDKFQFTNKRLVYGDFFAEYKGTKYNVLSYNGVTYDSIINPDFTPPELSFTIPLLSGKVPIDDLYITLPCGMRNGSDNIAYLQQLCDSNAFRSNNINILVKNLNITNQAVLDGVTQTITTSLQDFIPSNSKVKNITFENYK